MYGENDYENGENRNTSNMEMEEKNINETIEHDKQNEQSNVNETDSEQSKQEDTTYRNVFYQDDFSSASNSNTQTEQQEEQKQEQQNYYNYYNPYTESSAYHSTIELEEKKKKGRWKKGMLFIAKAALFGVIAGGVFFGVNYGIQKFAPFKEEDSNVKLPVTVTASSGTNSSGATMVLDVSDIVEEVMPSVVSVVSRVSSEVTYGPFTLGKQEYDASGSGIIVGQSDTELLIVTNNHVIEGAETVTVTFSDATPEDSSDDISVDALIKGARPDNDLAVIAVPLEYIPEEVLSYIKIASLGNSDELKVGEGTIAIGNALGYGQSVTTGCVSALNRQVTIENLTLNMIQTDAAINSGNSGGALLNMKGEVIGINSAKALKNGVEGMGYAIPISSVMDILNELMNRKTRTLVEEGERGYLGIRGVNIDASYSNSYGTPVGISVQQVLEGSAAEKAGIKKYDIITKFDGQTITSMADLQDLLQYYRAGETVTIIVEYMENHEYVERELEITLGKIEQ